MVSTELPAGEAQNTGNVHGGHLGKVLHSKEENKELGWLTGIPA